MSFLAHLVHTLKTTLAPKLLENWKTATLYLFVHVVAGLYSTHFASRTRSSYCFLVGILIFSGSLYTYVLTEAKTWGMLPPFGGIAFILGWFFLTLDARRH